MVMAVAAGESARVIRLGNSPVNIANERMSCASCVGRVETRYAQCQASPPRPTCRRERADVPWRQVRRDRPYA